MVKDQCSRHIERSQFLVFHTQRCLVARRLQMFSRRFHRRKEIVDVGIKETLPFLGAFLILVLANVIGSIFANWSERQ